MEKTYAIIENEKVVNVVIWDGESDWLHEGEAVELTGPGGIDWDYIDGEFVDNRPVTNLIEENGAL
jgi:hypothetical protein